MTGSNGSEKLNDVTVSPFFEQESGKTFVESDHWGILQFVRYSQNIEALHWFAAKKSLVDPGQK